MSRSNSPCARWLVPLNIMCSKKCAKPVLPVPSLRLPTRTQLCSATFGMLWSGQTTTSSPLASRMVRTRATASANERSGEPTARAPSDHFKPRSCSLAIALTVELIGWDFNGRVNPMPQKKSAAKLLRPRRLKANTGERCSQRLGEPYIEVKAISIPTIEIAFKSLICFKPHVGRTGRYDKFCQSSTEHRRVLTGKNGRLVLPSGDTRRSPQLALTGTQDWACALSLAHSDLACAREATATCSRTRPRALGLPVT